MLGDSINSSNSKPVLRNGFTELLTFSLTNLNAGAINRSGNTNPSVSLLLKHSVFIV